MRTRLTRLVSGAAACAVATGTATILLGASPAFAAGSLAGPATLVVPGGSTPLNAGGSATQFSLSLGNGASCRNDSTTGGERVQTYIVPASVDPSTLTFNSAGPVAAAGQFRAALYDPSGSPYVNKVTQNATPPATTGQINQPLPAFSYGIYAPGDIPPGAYNIGVACTNGPVGPTQMHEYWNTVATFTADPADSPAQIHWAYGAIPATPVLTSVTAGNTQATVSYTTTASTPAATAYTITAVPTAGPTVTASGSSTTGTLTGLVNGTSYSVTVTQTNSTGTSPASNAISVTPSAPPHPAVTNLTAVPGPSKVDLSWTAPADAGTTAPTGYTIATNPVTPAGASTSATAPAGATSSTVTPLTAGNTYSFTVTATYAAAPGGTPATSATVAPSGSAFTTQTLTVTRPAGALVLTQVCGRNGALAADTTGTPGFPTGSLPAVAATNPAPSDPATAPGTAPTFGGSADPAFGQYPYPELADGTPAPNYPTNCGIALGNAKFVKKGPGGGQFFAASGVLNQVTVVDTRDTDIGWTANGNMGAFSAGAGKSFSGSQLGWTPVATSSSPLFADSDGVTYDQVTSPGAVVLPNTPNATGMSAGRALGTAPAVSGTTAKTGGLGIAEFDARLKLLIPITAKSGSYTGVLTISAL